MQRVHPYPEGFLRGGSTYNLKVLETTNNISLQEVDGVEIIFVSSDQSQDAMVAYMKESHGDWWAVEYGSDPVKALKEHFGVSGIPMLVVLDKDGKLITKDGRGDVSGKGPASVAHWKKA